MTTRASLPDPDPAALERSRALGGLIAQRIATTPELAIGFDDYMAMALYTPELGYYTGPQAIFGEDGDFVTAPESGELFGRCVANQCREILEGTGGGIVEYGAGSGALAVTLLHALSAGGTVPDYHIVEPSTMLRARQRERIAQALPALADHVTWSTAHPPVPHTGVVVANEVLDAMPARRYRVADDGALHELGVGLAQGQLSWRKLSRAAVPAQVRAAVDTYPSGYCCEDLPGLPAWLDALRGALDCAVVLLIDYGYPAHEFFHPDRASGTLKCHYRHLMHGDPFVYPGLQDLTTAVNFTALAEAAHMAGFTLSGYTAQNRFLPAAGLAEVMASAAAGDPEHTYRLAQEAKRLLLPGEMGQTCKVMALGADCAMNLSGFRDDERHRLGGFET